MWAGIAQAVPGRRLGDISNAVERAVRGSGDYGLIREYTGHGIGTEMHMEPAVRNYGPAGQGPRLVAGMALAIEPMITRGGREVAELDDGWTVVSVDGSRAAHFEHTVAITAAGPWVLTALEGATSAAAERAGVRLSRQGPSPAAASAADDDRLATRTAPGGDGDVG
jgi:methionyl aminopeptidase